nr:MAG TPA: hypothetical protein [Caudoviricetes sp.]
MHPHCSGLLFCSGVPLKCLYYTTHWVESQVLLLKNFDYFLTI